MFWLPALLLLLQEQPTFQSEVTLVHVDAEVRQDGRAIESLGKESFRITDSGKPQRILHFGHDNEPLDVALFFDVSSETRLAIQRVTDAAHTVLSELREGDRLAVIITGDLGQDCKPRLVSDLSGDFGNAERRITDIALQEYAGGHRCELLLGIRSATEQFLLQPRAGRRRSIIVVTDDLGTATAPRLVRDTVRDLWTADAVVLGVIVHSGNVVVSIGPPHRGARYAADMTGGDTVNSDDAVEGLHAIIKRIRQRYSLDYAMPRGTPGEARKISMRLAGDMARRYPRAQVKARRGYVVPKE
jgi:VWFA-related protein